jgi:hypothetical protein
MIMSGLTDKAGGNDFQGEETIAEAQKAWQESMARQMGRLREDLRSRNAGNIAALSGAELRENKIYLTYWRRPAYVDWESFDAFWMEDNQALGVFDAAMLLYYLHDADGTPMADDWISYRQLPGGAFYHLAYQRYSGDIIARVFGDDPEAYIQACRAFGGDPLTAISDYAFAFQPLPRIRLATVLWPGDEDFHTKAAILFDASGGHYLTTDGLGLLAGGLASRIVKLHKAERGANA